MQPNIATNLLTRRPVARMVYALVVLALMMPAFAASPARWVDPATKTHPALLDMATKHPTESVRVIVLKSAQSSAPEQLVQSMGGTIVSNLSIINAFVAQVPAGNIESLAASNDVRWVSPDAPVQEAST
ncbi:MAG TPA: hypothetical protein VLQ48_15205, partial [Chloroflexia bacterium]|nr:hypothetical protein [Chloroflexia bacterium]